MCQGFHYDYGVHSFVPLIDICSPSEKGTAWHKYSIRLGSVSFIKGKCYKYLLNQSYLVQLVDLFWGLRVILRPKVLN